MTRKRIESKDKSDFMIFLWYLEHCSSSEPPNRFGKVATIWNGAGCDGNWRGGGGETGWFTTYKGVECGQVTIVGTLSVRQLLAMSECKGIQMSLLGDRMSIRCQGEGIMG